MNTRPIIELRQTERIDDASGRKILTWTPILHPNILALGQLRFACWSAWEDEPETHAAQASNARSSAIEALKAMADSVI